MNAQKLSQTAMEYNAKQFRKNVLAEYKAIKRSIKRQSKNGKRSINFKFVPTQYKGEELYTAVRFFSRRHKDFYTRIDIEYYEEKGWKELLYADAIYVFIEW